jgi:hypothetical protein
MNTGGGNTAAMKNAAAVKAPTVTSQSVKKPSQNIVQKAGAVVSQTADIATKVAQKSAEFVGHTAVDIGREFSTAGNALADVVGMGSSSVKLRQITQQRAILDAKQTSVVSAYKNGKMSKDNYTQSLKELSQSYQDLGNEDKKLIQDTDIRKRVESVVMSAVDVLTLGRATSIKALATQGGKQVGTRFLAGRTAVAVDTKVADLITKVPAARELIERNARKLVVREAQQMAGETTTQWLSRESRRVAVGLLVKRPLFYQMNIGGAEAAYDDMMKGNYGSAAAEVGFIGAQMIGGGPLGWFFNKGKKTMGDIKALALGQGSFVDAVSRRMGQNSTWMAQKIVDLRKTDPETAQKIEDSMRIIQEVNLRMAGDDAERAADLFLRTYTDAGADLTKLSFKEVATRADKWVRSYDKINSMVKSGLVEGFTAEDVGKLLPVRWAKHDQYGLIDSIKKGTPENPGAQQIKDIVEEVADRAGSWGASETLVNRINDVLNTARAGEGKTHKEAVMDGIKKITTASIEVPGIPKKIAEELAADGYIVGRPMGRGGIKTPAVELDDTRKLISSLNNEDANAIFELAQMPHPGLAAISGALDKTGLSMQSRNELSYNTLKKALAGTIDGLPVTAELGIATRSMETGGDVILGKLQRYIENMKAAKIVRGVPGLNRVPAVTDIRQLTVSDIEEALSGAGFRLSRSGAKEIHTAVAEAYLKVPLELRGLGDRAVDVMAAAPGIGKAYRGYSRVQSALRYTYNPFFRTQERVETSILARMQASKFIWTSSRQEQKEVIQQLEDSGLFRSSLSGEAANDATFGRISANLSTSQKRNLAGLALDIAKTKGTTVEDMVQNHVDEIEDALKVVVQYPTTGVISSPLARTLNIVFFPMRYNAKVTYLAAKKISELPPSLQLATLTGLHNMRTWLKSDEGLAWQNEHADAIQVFSWLTPIGNITQAMNILSGSVDAPGNLGLLGGLPFGVISQILDSQGIIQLNTPYVDPKTGDVVPKYIPETTKARAATALQDLLGSTFSFPGRTLGLPGKASTIRNWVSTVIDPDTNEYRKEVREEDLTPLQKKMIQVIKNGGSDDDIDEALYHSPAEGQYDGYTLPSPDEFTIKPLVTPSTYTKRTGLPSSKKSKTAKGLKAKKKALPIPAR